MRLMSLGEQMGSQMARVELAHELATAIWHMPTRQESNEGPHGTRCKKGLSPGTIASETATSLPVHTSLGRAYSIERG